MTEKAKVGGTISDFLNGVNSIWKARPASGKGRAHVREKSDHFQISDESILTETLGQESRKLIDKRIVVAINFDLERAHENP